MKRILIGALAVLGLAWCALPAAAQTTTAKVVTSCGGQSLPSPATGSPPAPITIDQTGDLCTNAGGGGGGGGAVTVADGADVTLGAKADSACGTATGTCSLEALIKFLNNAAISAIPPGTNYVGQFGLNAVATGGWTPKHFIAANSDNATNLKASAGIVHAVQVFGIGSAPAYLKFYNKASSPTCGSDAVVKSVMIPASSTAALGSGAIAVVLDTQFSTGISYCVVTGIADSDDTSVAATTFNINIDWL